MSIARRLKVFAEKLPPRPPIGKGYINNPIKIGTKVKYQGKVATVEGPSRYKHKEPWLLIKFDDSHKQLSVHPNDVKLITKANDEYHSGLTELGWQEAPGIIHGIYKHADYPGHVLHSKGGEIKHIFRSQVITTLHSAKQAHNSVIASYKFHNLKY